MPDPPGKFQQKFNFFLSLVVIFLLIVVPPMLCGLLYLSRVPDVTWERSDGVSFDRIWLYRERGPAGLAYQSRRTIATYNPTEICAQNKLRFWLWRKSAQALPSVSSQRMILVEGRWQPTGEACQ